MKYSIVIGLFLIGGTLLAQSSWDGVMEMNSAKNFAAEIYNNNNNDFNSCIEVDGVLHHPLAAAIAKEANGIVDYLLHINQTNLSSICNDLTILQYAIKYGDEELVKRLLQKGADPQQKSQSGQSALELAMQLDKPILVGYLKSLSK